ncbi:hypothetical protein [Parapedobacter indicus]|uniref:Uncharacterized protein n=1 Tax=Parapedobacter indicus TaxID=1477437 RepID=A0A1I3V210_9SPHI|nr:hypothetical protein [Parapedobacter indicus]PPK99002.1 hypothetical protein CLV26_11532 [Parapedobacter indicus]SFJ88989.1 hypothetical protein SAMN05444682_115145 [Parapedobacter indicus]
MTELQFEIVSEQRLETLFTYAQVHFLAKQGSFILKNEIVEDENEDEEFFINLCYESGKVAICFKEQVDGLIKLIDKHFE